MHLYSASRYNAIHVKLTPMTDVRPYIRGASRRDGMFFTGSLLFRESFLRGRLKSVSL
jgi:hypothetical protein